ncbi:MAG: RIP metalloprotease RseP [Terracidiphilus sp.]|jgi:regulator of sigma E protease
MIDFHHLLVTIVAFIVLIGVMVVVHEFGHFAAAKLCRVRVERFSIGFPPRLFGVKIGETDYCFSATLVGGYVKMTGENFAELSDAAAGKATVAPPDAPGALTSHPRWQRMLIGTAGPVANFVLAFVLMFAYYGWINEVPVVEVKQTTIEWVTPGSSAAQAGLQPGDTIRHFAGVDNPDWEKVYDRFKLNTNQTIPVTVERGGNTLQLSFHVPAAAKDDDFVPSDAGLWPQQRIGPIGVQQVQPGTPAEQAGLRAGDAIQSVDGHAFHQVETLLAYMKAGQGKPMSLVILRNGAALPAIVAHPAMLDGGWKLGFMNMPPPTHRDPLPWGMAVTKSREFCADKSFLIFEVLRGLFTHKVSVTQLAGPVGIARVAGDTAETMKLGPMIWLAAFISVNLGILNLMPFPILDGGMILILLIEGALRRDISINIKERIYQGAFVLLVAFFVFITFNDIAKLPFFTHLKP